jgi:iron complex transport system ATP-binding protein
VFIARALAQEAPILVLDEPIASLDIARQEELLALLADLHKEGCTILVSLHDPRLALDYFPRAAILAGGRLAATGATEEVVLGPTMETTFGIWVRRGEGWRIETIARQPPRPAL